MYKLKLYGEKMLPNQMENAAIQKHFSKARRLISAVLGFTPPFQPTGVDPREVPIAYAIDQYKNGTMTEKELFDIVYNLSVALRNEEMRKKKRNMRPIDLADIERYKSYLPQHYIRAHKYLHDYLGYSPDIENSLHAELHVRFLCQEYDETDESIKSVMRPLAKSYAMGLPKTIVKYREIFLPHGWEEADKSPLVAVDEEAFRMYLNSKH